jgi:hypothetical protein
MRSGAPGVSPKPVRAAGKKDKKMLRTGNTWGGRWRNRGAVPPDQIPEWQADWRPPVELQRSTPRSVRLTGSGFVAAVFLFVLLAGSIALGVGLAVYRHREQSRSAALAATGVTVDARVLRTGIDSGKERHRYIIYQYSANGAPRQGRTTLSRKEPRRFEAGDIVPVRYIPAQPRSSWLAGYGPEGPPAWVPIVAPLGVLAGAVAIIIGLHRQRRALSEGRPAQARVLSCKRYQSQHSGGYRVELEYRTIEGSVRKIKANMQRRPDTGAIITVLYDPDNPKRASVYPICSYRVDRGFGN